MPCGRSGCIGKRHVESDERRQSAASPLASRVLAAVPSRELSSNPGEDRGRAIRRTARRGLCRRRSTFRSVDVAGTAPNRSRTAADQNIDPKPTATVIGVREIEFIPPRSWQGPRDTWIPSERRSSRLIIMGTRTRRHARHEHLVAHTEEAAHEDRPQRKGHQPVTRKSAYRKRVITLRGEPKPGSIMM